MIASSDFFTKLTSMDRFSGGAFWRIPDGRPHGSKDPYFWRSMETPDFIESLKTD
tara:strand:+ start:834 stop:998 length:165 start_codon:yes stop_codon:yes gene_type:complete